MFETGFSLDSVYVWQDRNGITIMRNSENLTFLWVFFPWVGVKAIDFNSKSIGVRSNDTVDLELLASQ